MNNKMLELAKELKAAAIKLKVNKYDHVWLKNELTDDWCHGSPYEYFALLSNYHQVIELCEYIEHASKINEYSSRIIEAFCADDAEWHKLLDASEQESSTLISLVVKLADKYTEVQKELERINNLQPVAWMYPVFHDEKMQFTTDAVASENIDIHFQSHGSPLKVTPLYKLDK
ncbi:hypothetical protein ABN222_06160 [Providencia alcalifaciens]